MPPISRDSLRKGYKQLRKELSLSYRQEAAIQVCQRMESFPPYKRAKRIALYHAFQGELSLVPLWKMAISQDKQCYFPVVRKDKTLRFHEGTPDMSFESNAYGILEPKSMENNADAIEIEVDALDLMLLPLLAFDTHGRRLGFGQGYYDRSLAEKRPPYLVGVAYPFQHSFYLYSNPWDIPLTDVVTTDILIHCDPSILSLSARDSKQ